MSMMISLVHTNNWHGGVRTGPIYGAWTSARNDSNVRLGKGKVATLVKSRGLTGRWELQALEYQGGGL
jgi:hypothetical protein